MNGKKVGIIIGAIAGAAVLIGGIITGVILLGKKNRHIPCY